MSFEDIGPRPGDSPTPYQPEPAPAPPPGRRSLGPGYDFILEFMRQIGRPATFVVCLFALVFQITAPPDLRLDGVTFGLFIGLLAALCGLRSVDIANARNALAPA